MSALLDDLVVELLRQSLGAWRICGDVQRDPDGTLRLTAGTKVLRIARSSANPHFRWTVSIAGHTRNVTAVAGLLRTVRAALDPGYQPVRLRIAPLPIMRV